VKQEEENKDMAAFHIVRFQLNVLLEVSWKFNFENHMWARLAGTTIAEKFFKRYDDVLNGIKAHCIKTCPKGNKDWKNASAANQLLLRASKCEGKKALTKVCAALDDWATCLELLRKALNKGKKDANYNKVCRLLCTARWMSGMATHATVPVYAMDPQAVKLLPKKSSDKVGEEIRALVEKMNIVEGLEANQKLQQAFGAPEIPDPQMVAEVEAFLNSLEPATKKTDMCLCF